jgi:hypothetical protein
MVKEHLDQNDAKTIEEKADDYHRLSKDVIAETFGVVANLSFPLLRK